MYDYGWPTFWGVVTLAFLAFLTFSVKSCSQDSERDRQQIMALVKQGQSPIAARCAIKGTGETKDALICQAAALQGVR